MAIYFSKRVGAKLARDDHNVTLKEIEECFHNCCPPIFLYDTRAEHKSDPPTQWFVAPTNHNRLLKVMFCRVGTDFEIKSAYEANERVIDLYRRRGNLPADWPWE